MTEPDYTKLMEKLKKPLNVSAAGKSSENESSAKQTLEKEAVDGIEKRKSAPSVSLILQKKMEAAASLIAIPGHPLHTFSMENDVLRKEITEAHRLLASEGKISYDRLQRLRQSVVHYDKKGDLLYPHLKAKYGISGPSDLMWTDDDDIRDELSALSRILAANGGREDSEWKDRLAAVLQKAENMIRIEERTLFPSCAMNFSEEEWIGIYFDSKDYRTCFDVENGIWEAAEAYGRKNYLDRKMQSSSRTAQKAEQRTPVSEQTAQRSDQAAQNSSREKQKGDKAAQVEATEQVEKTEAEVIMPGGHMTVKQLTALLNTIPMEITFVDDQNINRFFNEGPKVFKRPQMALDREVFSCHPPKIEQQVRRIFDEFRAGTLDEIPIWSEKDGSLILTTYRAVRSSSGEYLGTVELVQNMDSAREYFRKTDNGDV